MPPVTEPVKDVTDVLAAALAALSELLMSSFVIFGATTVSPKLLTRPKAVFRSVNVEDFVVSIVPSALMALAKIVAR